MDSPQLKPVPVALLAISAGAIVANLYYNQPLLALMATSFHVTDEAVGSIPTVTQLGYGAAMLFLVPLGDRYERRSLIVLMTWASALSLLLVAFAPSLPLLAAASLLLGAASMVPQYVVPYAATAAHPQQRGKVVGTVMGGLLIGILLSRTVSGVVGEHFGWRVMYIAAAVAMVIAAVILRARLPPQAPEQKVPLATLYRSILHIVRDEPVVRLHSVLGGLAFASFSVFWSTLAFQIAGPPFHYGSSVVGLSAWSAWSGPSRLRWSGASPTSAIRGSSTSPRWWSTSSPSASSPPSATAWPVSRSASS